MRFNILSFVALAITTGAVAAQLVVAPINPPDSVVKHVDWSALPPASPDPATNAKRFAKGLPPITPTKRRPHRGGPHRDGLIHRGGTRIASAPRSQTSPSLPVQQECNVFATYANGSAHGYISPVWNIFGEYYAFQPNQDGSLLVSFTYSPDSPSQLAFTAKNGPSNAYPLFGGITGFASTGSSLGPGSSNYAYLGGTTPTPPGSPAVAGANSFTAATGANEPIESAIWTYDPVTYVITAQWINEDGSTQPTYIVYLQGVLCLTGDIDAVTDVYGPADTLRFKCVPPGVAPIRF